MKGTYHEWRLGGSIYEGYISRVETRGVAYLHSSMFLLSTPFSGANKSNSWIEQSICDRVGGYVQRVCVLRESVCVQKMCQIDSYEEMRVWGLTICVSEVRVCGSITRD